jgi:CHAT domain-containing protein/tetratricopeptide (TPR) repeat protein
MALTDQALTLAEQIKDRVGLAMVYRRRGATLANAGRFQDATAWFAKALSEFEALGNLPGVALALSGLTFASQGLGDAAKAKEYGARALKAYEETGDDLGRGWVLHYLTDYEPVPQRAARYEEILNIAKRTGSQSLQGSVLRSLGAGRFNAGDLDGARKYYEEAIAALEAAGNLYQVAAAYLGLGRVYRAHGDYAGALARYQKAIDFFATSGDRFTIVEAWNAKAVALGFLGRRDEELAATEKGLALARESGNQRLIDFMEGNLAGSLSAAGQHERAVTLLREIIARKPEPYLAPFRYGMLGVALGRLGRFEEAVEPMSEAIRLTREQKQVESLATRLDNRAWVLESLGRFEAALVDSREALGVIEQTRTRLIPADFLRQGYSDAVQNAYLRIVRLLSSLGRPVEALETAEQGRARAFLDLLAARDANPDIALTTRGAATTPKPSEATPDPAATPVGVREMGAIARRLQSTIVTYWVNEDMVLAWVLAPDAELRHVRIPVTRERVTALVAATTAPLRDSAGTGATRGADANAVMELPLRGLGLLALSRDDKAAWRELYTMLVEPLRAHLPARGGRITIVPHGPLFQLSFAALQSPAGRYLIEDYELHFAPAVSALAVTERMQRANADNRAGPWTIVGNPATLPSVGSRPLLPLPGAAREIASIAALAPGGRAIRLDGAAASEAALAKSLDGSRPSLLHFATHGFVVDDPKTPAFLALNRQGTSTSTDGRLTVDEVYGLRLSTDLVVLSACRTGSGKVSSDGIVGLTRGFFYAGTPSVMATYWDVTDETTALLMTSFYRSYAKAGAKGGSLRSAQLALLADLRAGKVVITASGRRVTLPEHPLLWAAFFLSGEP